MNVVLPVFIFLFGTCIGSFLNVVVWRLPRGESIVFPGSRCPMCGRSIRWYDNIPVLSWILLKGRCRYCLEPISTRYPVIESLTGLLLLVIYCSYYVFDTRDAIGGLDLSWPVFFLHCFLACGLLACSIIDIEHWQVPLEICWLVAAAGAAVATFFHRAGGRQEWIPHVSPLTGAMAVGAGTGLLVANILQHRGVTEPSFIDAPPPKDEEGQNTDRGVALSKTDGINPRLEILRELVFLSPAFAGAIAAFLLASYTPPIRETWNSLLASPDTGPYINGFLASLFGYLVGGLWIWGARIFGTIAFGKEAMGLGDVHIMSAVGAVAGWVVPSVAFFMAPLLGIVWAICLAAGKGQRELPYGPWLSIASLLALIFYDNFEELIRQIGSR